MQEIALQAFLSVLGAAPSLVVKAPRKGDTMARGNPAYSGGPRLGKLQGLHKRHGDESESESEDDCCGPRRRSPSSKKEGIKVLPLVLMFVMFGPVVLTGIIYVFDLVANSGFAVKIGLSDDPRTRLTKFYQKHNPTKMRDVDKLMKKYKGRYAEMFKKLEDKYVRVSKAQKKQQEEEEEYLREQARYAEEERRATEGF